MTTCSVQNVYDYLRFGERGYYVEFHHDGRIVTITRMTSCIDTMPTCRITGDGPVRDEWEPSVLESLIERLLKEEDPA